MSSTTTPNWYMDWPNSSSPFPERNKTKSSISSFENSRSPNTASRNFVVSPRGTLKRTAGFTPGVDGLPSRQEHRETRRGGLWFLVLRRFGVIATGIFLRGAIAQKCGSIGQTFLRRCAIQFRSLRLVKRAFIPIDAQPLQAIQNSLHQFGFVPLRIGVLDAKNHRATLAACEQPVEQRGSGASHVQITGGGRCKSHPYGGGLLIRITHCQRVFPLEFKLSV